VHIRDIDPEYVRRKAEHVKDMGRTGYDALKKAEDVGLRAKTVVRLSHHPVESLEKMTNAREVIEGKCKDLSTKKKAKRIKDFVKDVAIIGKDYVKDKIKGDKHKGEPWHEKKEETIDKTQKVYDNFRKEIGPEDGPNMTFNERVDQLKENIPTNLTEAKDVVVNVASTTYNALADTFVGPSSSLSSLSPSASDSELDEKERKKLRRHKKAMKEARRQKRRELRKEKVEKQKIINKENFEKFNFNRQGDSAYNKKPDMLEKLEDIEENKLNLEVEIKNPVTEVQFEANTNKVEIAPEAGPSQSVEETIVVDERHPGNLRQVSKHPIEIAEEIETTNPIEMEKKLVNQVLETQPVQFKFQSFMK